MLTRLFPLFALVTMVSQGGVVGSVVGGLPQAPPPPSVGQPRDPAARMPPVGTASISGRVTDAETGVPIRRALVNLNGPLGRAAYTDHEGRYRFTNLPVGRYFVMANPGPNRAGYQPMQFGGSAGLMAGMMTRGKPIELADGTVLENVDIPLPRTGVITGRVTDGYGEPASRIQVTAWVLPPGGEPRQTGSAQTDDLGHYRLFGLAAGDYVVMANPYMGGSGVEIEGEPVGFAPTYAPGTPSQADAMRLRVGRGMEVAADIRLMETRVYSITGTALNSKGEAGRGMSVMLMRSEGPGGPSFGAPVSPNGTFTMRNVPPGEYQLIARYAPPREPGTMMQGPDPNQEFALVEVQVGISNVEGVVLATAPAPAVTGEVVFDEAPPPGRTAMIVPETTGRAMFFGPPRIDVKGTQFTIANVSGPILLRGSFPAGPGWGLKAVLLRGKDITDVPTTFTASDSGHVQVLFTAHGATLEGTVIGEDGKPTDEAAVMVFAQDPATWTPRSSYLRNSRTIKDGRFNVTGLRVGRYYAVALPPELSVGMMQPTAEFFESLSKVATAITLNADEKRTVELVVLRMER